eukprot:366444-Chlamydomonas_euryale.AAC.2
MVTLADSGCRCDRCTSVLLLSVWSRADLSASNYDMFMSALGADRLVLAPLCPGQVRIHFPEAAPVCAPYH